LSSSNQEIFLRPRFVLPSEKSQETILEEFLNEKNKEERKFIIKVIDEHVFIDVLKKDSHFWSPQLYLEISEEEHTTQIKGLFGPKPQVWTFFMFLHFVVGISFIGVGVWAYVSYTLEESLIIPVILLFVMPLIWILLYVVGRLGKDFGKSQIKKLHAFMLQTLES